MVDPDLIGVDGEVMILTKSFGSSKFDGYYLKFKRTINTYETSRNGTRRYRVKAVSNISNWRSRNS
jgi:hypothetical protein